MKGGLPAFLTLALVAAARGSEGESWASVPASPGAGAIGVLALPGIRNWDVVRLVGNGDAEAKPSTPRGPVFSVEIQDHRPTGEATGVESGGEGAPANALRPDANGVILFAARSKEGGPPQKTAAGGAVFACGGIIIPGGGAAVAILNGHLAAQNDRLGGFRVVQIIADAVVLERDGTFFVIPRGRRVTLAATGN